VSRPSTEHNSTALPLGPASAIALRRIVCRLLLVLVRRWTMFSERRVDGGTSRPFSHSSADVIHAYRFRASSLTFAWRRGEREVASVPVHIVWETGCSARLNVMIKRNVQIARNQNRATQLPVSHCTSYCSDTEKSPCPVDLVARPRFERRLALKKD
jgi:hypothetical protein